MPANENEFWAVTLSASFVLSCVCSKESMLFDVVLLTLIKGFTAAVFHGSLQTPPAKHQSSENDILKSALQTPIFRLLNAAKLKAALFERK